MSFSTNPRRRPARPPSIRKPTSLPRGPKWEQELRVKTKLFTGPGQAPPGFVGGTTSNLEWIAYWALFKIFAPLADPRNPPYWGIEGVFRYQQAVDRGRARGGTVLDFLVEYGPEVDVPTAIQINGSRYHDQVSARQLMEDRMRKTRLSATMNVVDVWDYDLLDGSGSPGTGEQAVVAIKRALGMIDPPSRTALGTSRDVRYRGLGG